MKQHKRLHRRMPLLGGLLVFSMSVPAWAQQDSTTTGREQTPVTGGSTNYAQWDRAYPPFADGPLTGGFGAGILGSTPDGTAFAINANLDYFVDRRVSLGPLLQLGFTGDMTQIGLSGQAKYWIPLDRVDNRSRVNLQTGLGFVHADHRGGDTSWLIPIGVGYEYEMDSGTEFTATALINFTDLKTGRGSDADVMPGFAFGVRF